MFTDANDCHLDAHLLDDLQWEVDLHHELGDEEGEFDL